MNTNKELLSTIREALEEARRVFPTWDIFKDAIAALDQLEAQQAQAQPVGYTNKEEIATAQSGQISGGAFWLHATGHTNIPLYTNPQQADIAKLIEAGDAMVDCIKRLRALDLGANRPSFSYVEEWEAAKSAAPAQQQPKRLTDEEIDSYARTYTHPYSTEIRRALIKFRDNGYMGGLSVGDAEQVVKEWCLDWCERVAPDEKDWSDLRARLIAKAQGK
jgi:hypothetical protein